MGHDADAWSASVRALQVTNYKASVLLRRPADASSKVLEVSRTFGVEELSLALLLLAKLSWQDRHVKRLLSRDQVPSRPEDERREQRRRAGLSSPERKGQGGQQGTQQAQGPQKRAKGQRGGEQKGGDAEVGEDEGEDEKGGCSQTRWQAVQGSKQRHQAAETAAVVEAALMQPEGKGQDVPREGEEEEEDGCSSLTQFTFRDLGVTGELAGCGRFGNVLKVRCACVGSLGSASGQRAHYWLRQPPATRRAAAPSAASVIRAFPTQGWFDGMPAIIKLFHSRVEGAEEAFRHELHVYTAFPKSVSAVRRAVGWW